MKCENEEIQAKLGDFFSQHLPENESEQVKSHLLHCESCQQDLRAIKIVAGCPARVVYLNYEGHLDSGLIARYYESRGDLGDSAIQVIESHLKECEICAYDVQFLKDMEVDLVTSAERTAARPSILETTAGFLAAFLRKPALAYFLLALAIYPAVRWLTMDEKEYIETRQYQLHEAIRSGGEVAEVIRARADSVVVVAVNHYFNTAEFEYNVRAISLETSKLYEIQNVRRFRGPDSVIVILNTSPLADGQYTLELIEVDLSDWTDSTFQSYPFWLTTE